MGPRALWRVADRIRDSHLPPDERCGVHDRRPERHDDSGGAWRLAGRARRVPEYLATRHGDLAGGGFSGGRRGRLPSAVGMA